MKRSVPHPLAWGLAVEMGGGIGLKTTVSLGLGSFSWANSAFIYLLCQGFKGPPPLMPNLVQAWG